MNEQTKIGLAALAAAIVVGIAGDALLRATADLQGAVIHVADMGSFAVYLTAASRPGEFRPGKVGLLAPRAPGRRGRGRERCTNSPRREH